LLANPLAKDSKLFAFSDGPKSTEDEANIAEIRDYLRKVSGFAEITLEFSEENKGLAKSIIEGVGKVINEYGSVIVLEDDLLVSKDFLEFMNKGLEFYKNEKTVGSISGYSFLLEKCESASELNLVQRISSWAWGTWKDRWENVDWDLQDFETFKKDKQKIEAFKNGGQDLWAMIQKQQKGIINSWAIRWTYHHFKYGMYCLVPKYSKVKNIGTDGSGTNFSKNTDDYLTETNENKAAFKLELKNSKEVNLYIRETFRSSIIRKCINFFKFRVFA
jgi:hypothetical protein